jgi:hypothetical protein
MKHSLQSAGLKGKKVYLVEDSRKHFTQPRRQVNMHNVNLFVMLDDLIYYTLALDGIRDSAGDTALHKVTNRILC